MREMYREWHVLIFEGWTAERTRRAVLDVLVLAAFVITSSWIVHP